MLDAGQAHASQTDAGHLTKGPGQTGTAAAGLFIALEGGDGAGKSTQLAALEQALSARRREVVTTREPGGTPLGAQVRELLLHAGAVSPQAEALLFAADRAQHVHELIEPALARGAVVLTDRFVDSSLAYQGARAQLNPADVQALAQFATGGLRPHLTVLLDVPTQVGSSRRRRAPDRIESESTIFHERVRANFLALARCDPGRYLVLDADAAPEQISAAILARVDADAADRPRAGGDDDGDSGRDVGRVR